ncbi:MAG: alpha/beta fold hydrolase, partial [Pseudomonadota bacterium]
MPLILTLALAGLLLLYPPTSAAELAFKSCWLNGSGGNGNLNAECATWQRPLDPGKPEGKQIELFVTRLASTALQPAEDALTIVNGGPGGSSVDLLVDLASIISALTRNRDVIVIDQRGTGRSSPLHCEALSDSVEVLEEDQIRSLTRQCLRNLPHDPRFFSTTVAVDDLEALRQTLGYRQLSLYGVSYGTRVVQQYMRAYPEQTRAVVIDGVVPPQRVLGGSVAIHSDNSLQAVFARCAATATCAGRFPQLKEDFSTLSARLRAAPITLQLQHPVTGLPTEVDLDYAHLAMWIRFALYAPETTALIPLIIHQATHSQNYLPIAANALRFLHDITAALNYGMHNAVVCTEDAPFFAQQQVDYT